MPATRLIARLLTAIMAFCFMAACDDDDENKTPKYDVTIFVSEHIDINANGDTIVRIGQERKFKKPRIEVHTPEGVEVEHWTRPKRKGTIYDFTPIALPAIAVFLLIAAIRLACIHPDRIDIQV